MSVKKKFIYTCFAAAVLVAAWFIMITLVGCGNVSRDVSIGVSVNGVAQTGGGTYSATVNTPYDVTATASDKSAVKVSYAFEAREAQAFSGKTFTPEEIGSYVFKFSAKNAKDFILTFNVTADDSKSVVIFDLGNHASQDGVAPPAQTVVVGGTVILPEKPTAADGYVFVGWFDGQTVYGEGAFYVVQKTVTLTALWDSIQGGAAQYFVGYAFGDHADAHAVIPATKRFDDGTSIVLESAPKAAVGYQFKGWSDGLSVYGAGSSYTVTKAVTFTAVWEKTQEQPQQYSVSYALGAHAAANATAPASRSVDEGTEITLADAPNAASSYVFDGWTDGAKKYAAGAKYTVNGKVTFTATWVSQSSVLTQYMIVNGDFELGNLTGWTYQNGTDDGQILGAKAVCADTTFFAEVIPFNQGGTYHFDGWKAKNDENEGHTYSIKSTTFTLGGSGFISFKMGGKAACVMVYDADEDMPIAEYKNTAFKDVAFPNLDEGSRLATLTTFVADLSKYLGKRLYIELCDITVEGNWGVAFFDDIVTYYSTAPNVVGCYDTVQFYKGGYAEGKQTTEYNIPWVTATNSYINTEIIGQNILTLGFEGTGFTEKNTNGSEATSNINGVLNDPRFQDAPVQPYRPNGIEGKALSFDGYSQYLSFAGDVSGRALTIDVYVCPRAYAWSAPQDSPDRHAAQTIVGSFDSGAKKGFMLGITKFGYPTFRVGTGSDWYILYFDPNTASCRLPTYTWSRLTAVFDGMKGKMSLYINGKLARTLDVKKGSSILSSGKEILVGASSEPAYEARFEITKFNGLMDNLSVVTEVSSAEQVTQSGKAIPAIDYDTARLPDYALANDWYRPQYHAVPPGNWMNEPHTLFRYNNKWHLFYQYNPVGPYWRNICWGHWVSDDMVQWKYVKEAVIPTEGTITPDGVWTGNVVYDKNNHPVLLITAGDDSRPYNGSNQHVGLVYAKDYSDPYLTEWVIGDFAVKQTAAMGKAGEFRDAQAFGIGNDRYMVVGGQIDGKGAAHLFHTTADKLSDWEYKGNLYRPSDYKDEYGPVWEMPNLVPLPYENGTASGKYLFVFSPQAADFNVRYYIGTFNTSTFKFTPDFADAKRMDYVNNVFTGPTVYLDPQTNKVYICSIMQDQRDEEDRFNAGWAFAAGLPRELYLKSNGTLGIKHIDTSSAERNTLVTFSNKSLSEANSLLAAVNNDLIKIDYTISNMNGECGFRLKNGNDGYVRLYFTNNSAGLDTNSVNNEYQRAKGNFSGARSNAGNSVSGTIYIDKALIEAYFGDSATLSVYAYGRGKKLEVFGNATFSVTVTAMSTIHK